MDKPSSDLELAKLTATAYHEAGHAVAAVSLGRPIQKVTISPGQTLAGVRLGHCEMKKGRSKGSSDWLEDQVLILFAGMVSEAKFTGRYCTSGAAEDLRIIDRLLESRAGNERQSQRLHRRMLSKTEYLLDDEAHAQAIESIAAELLEKTTISGRAVKHFFDQAVQRYGDD
jgi:ATP-dependent Zn protease